MNNVSNGTKNQSENKMTEKEFKRHEKVKSFEAFFRDRRKMIDDGTFDEFLEMKYGKGSET